MLRPFHLALPCLNLSETRDFYTEKLGCRVGRSARDWVDLDLFGHQLVFHDVGNRVLPSFENPVDAHAVPIPHFGVLLEPSDFDQLASSLEGQVDFVIPPTVRFRGTAGEQRTLFIRDPNGYALEFKAFADDRYIFEPFV